MSQSRRAGIYTYAIVLLSIVGGMSIVLWGGRPPTLSGALLMTILVVLTAAAGYFPLPISKRTEVVVDTSLVFASGLLFPPPWAGFVTALGTLINLLAFRRGILDLSINTSVKFIEITVAQIVYLSLGGTIPPAFQESYVVVPLLGAMVTYMLLDRVLIATAVALFQGVDLGQVLFSNWTRAFKEDLALLLLGILTAMVVEVQAWALALTVVPVVLVYIALRNSLRLELLTLEAVEQMADVIDRRDPYTAGHSRRVADLAEKIAMAMGLPMEEVQAVRAAARVHDLGKIAIDASILNKPTRLTDEEWQAMRQHPVIGAEIIARFPEFARGADYVRYHHERWDGKGYPFGLRGEEIPLGARIIAVADTFDAMTTDRPYRKALTLDVVVEEFKRGAGVQWDADVVEAFLRVVGHTKTEKKQARSPLPEQGTA